MDTFTGAAAELAPLSACCIHCEHSPGWAHITFCPTCQPEQYAAAQRQVA